MGETVLKWADASWNPILGCLPTSPGCRRCYAATLASTRMTAYRIKSRRYEGLTTANGKAFNGRTYVLPPGHHDWVWPLRWPGLPYPRMGPGKPSLISVCDMSDLFFEKQPDSVISKALRIIVASDHIGLILTRRAQRMAEYFAALPRQTVLRRQPKLWAGFSAENQQTFDARWQHVRRLGEQAWTVWASIAPMIGPVKLPPDFLALRDRAWAICSGEQDPDGRFMNPDWARAVRDQCAAAGVPYFTLQMTAKRPIPYDLMVRQFPRVIVDRKRSL